MTPAFPDSPTPVSLRRLFASASFVGCGDKRTLDLDLILYGSDGKPVKRDETTSGQPAFEYTSDQIGSYYLVAHSRKVDDPSKPVEIAIAVTHK